MEIRRASPDEVDAITQLFVRSRNEMDYLPPAPEKDIPRIARWIWSHDELWVAADSDRLLGFLAIEHSVNLDAAVLEKLYVEPTEQNRGVGSALLDKAKALRPDGLHLWVFQRNTGAIRFYERHGFSLVKLTDGIDNMEREPDALYRWP